MSSAVVQSSSSPAVAGRSLPDLEAIVDSGLQTFVEVGQALAEIHDRQLYKDTHTSWAAYVEARWGFTRQRAGQIISATRTVEAIEATATAVDTPKTERQARELASLAKDDPEAAAAAWEASKETAAADGRDTPTAEQVRTAVEVEEAKSKLHGARLHTNPVVRDMAKAALKLRDANAIVDAVPRVNRAKWLVVQCSSSEHPKSVQDLALRVLRDLAAGRLDHREAGRIVNDAIVRGEVDADEDEQGQEDSARSAQPSIERSEGSDPSGPPAESSEIVDGDRAADTGSIGTAVEGGATTPRPESDLSSGKTASLQAEQEPTGEDDPTTPPASDGESSSVGYGHTEPSQAKGSTYRPAKKFKPQETARAIVDWLAQPAPALPKDARVDAAGIALQTLPTDERERLLAAVEERLAVLTATRDALLLIGGGAR